MTGDVEGVRSEYVQDALLRLPPGTLDEARDAARFAEAGQLARHWLRSRKMAEVSSTMMAVTADGIMTTVRVVVRTNSLRPSVATLYITARMLKYTTHSIPLPSPQEFFLLNGRISIVIPIPKTSTLSSSPSVYHPISLLHVHL